MDNHQTVFTTLAEAVEQQGNTIFLAGFNDYILRDSMLEAFVAELGEYSHIALDLGEVQVESLGETAADQLANIIEDGGAEDTIIHVVNFESSLLEEIIQGEEKIMVSLEEHPGQLGELFPARWILWVDQYTGERLEKEATGFCKGIHTAVNFLSDKGGILAKPYQTARNLGVQFQEEGRDTGESAELLLEAGHLLDQFHKTTRAMEYYQEALEAAGEDSVEAALARARMGNILYEQGKYADALQYLEIAATHLPTNQEGTLKDAGQTFRRLGQIQARTGYYEEAEASFVEGVSIYEGSGDHQRVGMLSLDKARLQERVGDLGKAIVAYEEAANAFDAAGDMKAAAEAFQQIGAIHQNQHRWKPALEAFQRALEFVSETDDEFLEAALEDSVDQMTEKVGNRNSGEKGEKKKGFLGRLFGG